MPFSARRFPLVLWAIVPLLVSAPALAQDIAPAEVLFNRGLADMDAGRYETGCEALAESQRLDPRPGTLFTLAFCESKRGRVATAVTRLNDFLALLERMPPDQRARQAERAAAAREERARLAPRVPELALVLPPNAPAGTVVTRDGQALGEASLGVGLPVDPGEHVVSTRAPGGPLWEQRVAIAEGEKKQLTLEVKAPPAVREVAPPPAASGGSEVSSGRRAAVYVAGGVGVAGVVLGGVMGALTFGKRSAVAEHCGAGIGDSREEACDATGFDATRSASTTGLVSTIGFGVGLAGLGAAAVLYWTEPKQDGRGGGAARAAPRWIGAGVIAAGPGATVVGARGVW
ncbi:hypothetical protein WME99_38455 [Sorangium sp. So ce136]|uniref:tetratricopeptide repeat protein n=1 Tax=Sorangium sp. So ce136 TaxID=3133284 RepID=UPI003EFE11E2